MIKIRIHGRGGQGVVSAAELIALAAFYDGFKSQAFPVFGVERTGAPIQSFVRISKEKILSKEQIYQPDIIIVQDPTLLNAKDTLSGAKEKTKLIVNSEKTCDEIFQIIKKKIKIENIYKAPATKIALEIIGQNIVNTVTLGIFARHSQIISLKSLLRAINEKFKDKGKKIIDKNCQAIKIVYNYEK
jgi:pyruvate ferredoxin oxidoreductase gamma subunit